MNSILFTHLEKSINLLAQGTKILEHIQTSPHSSQPPPPLLHPSLFPSPFQDLPKYDKWKYISYYWYFLEYVIFSNISPPLKAHVLKNTTTTTKPP